MNATTKSRRNQFANILGRLIHDANKKPMAYLGYATLCGLSVILLGGLFLPLDGIGAVWQNPEAICQNTSTVVCTGFEEGNFNLWDDYDGNPSPWNLLVQNPGTLNYAPNHVSRMRVPSGRGQTDITKILPGTYDRLYARWYQMWEPGYDFNARNHGGGLHAGDRSLLGHSDFRPTGTDWFSGWVEPDDGRLNIYTYYRGMYQDCANPNGSCWGDRFPCMYSNLNYCEKPQHRPTIMPPLLETGRWYCIEMMIDAGTPTSSEAGANGQMNLWIDNVEYGPWTDLWFRTTSALKLNIFWLNIFHHEAHSVEGIMQDNAVVSTQRIGCLNDAPPSQVPSAPRNLRVQ